MSTQEVCRLCLAKDNLLFVFDKQLEKSDYLKDVILITTGVEIHAEDVISQKICTKCGQHAFKMYQFRQQSLKSDRFLKAQCRELLRHTDLKIPNSSVTNEPEIIVIEDQEEEPRCKPPYKVHPTMTALSRKYPMLHFPSICVLFNVDPCVSMEMDTVENHFKSRNLNLKKYARLALTASDKNIPKKTSTITKYPEKSTENSETPRITDHVAQSTSTAISETVEVVNKVSPINIKINQSGYSIVRPSTENIIHSTVKNVCESTSSTEESIADSPEFQSGIRSPKKRTLSGSDILSEPPTKKVLSANPSNKISVLSNIEIKSSVFKCNICSSIQFSAKHLKKHQIKHSRCKFCKTQFKSVGMKQQHIENSCLVKDALNILPEVEVERVELNVNVRIHHQDALTIFPPLPGLEEIDSTSISSKAAEEIIEIISDDEDTYVSTSSSLPATPICSKTPPTVTPSIHKNPALSAVIRPDVRIKNSNILDGLKTPAADLEIMKELLSTLKNLQSVTDEVTQTELPTIESIRMDEDNLTTELINLRKVLHSYLVPVEIRKGSKVSASYNYQCTQPKPKSLKLWKVTPIDAETENNSISNETANNEHVITATPASHSNIITSGSDLVNSSGKSSDSFNNEETSLQNTGIITQASSNGSSPSPNYLETKSPAITTTQIESLIPTPECLSVVQAEPLATIPTESLNTEMQNGTQLLVPSHALEIVPDQATSPVTDVPNSRHSPKSSRIDQTTPEINYHSLEIYPEPSITSTPTLTDQTFQNNTVVSPTSCDLCHVNNSDSPRKSSIQSKTDVNANWNLSHSHSEVMDSTIITRHDSANRTIEYVVNNYSQSVDTGTINVRPPNGIMYSNNNNKKSLHISQAIPNSTMIQWNQNVYQHFPKATANYHNINVSTTTNSNVSSQNLYGNNFNPPLPYSNVSTLVTQMPQSCISSNTSNIAQAVYTAKTVQTVDRNYNAFLQYIPQVQEGISLQPIVEGAHTPLNSEPHHRQTGHSTASNSLRKILPRPKVSKSFSHYPKASNCVIDSFTVSPVNQNFDVSNRQLPNACTYQSILATCDTLPGSVPPSDKSQHFASGLIRVRNVRELT